MRKGLHIIRAILPELELRACLWCGRKLSETCTQMYTPVFKSKPHGAPRLCWDCAVRCSSLQGQPEIRFWFNNPAVRLV